MIKSVKRVPSHVRWGQRWKNVENILVRLVSRVFNQYCREMHAFELRPVENGFELRGGPLQQPMVFRDVEPRPAVHLVGYLSQLYGSELLIFNAAGEVIEARRYEPVVPMRGAIGGLYGPQT